MTGGNYAFAVLRRRSLRPATRSPEPSNSKDAGSGTAVAVACDACPSETISPEVRLMMALLVSEYRGWVRSQLEGRLLLLIEVEEEPAG
jgi:hypothetical protein